MRHDGIRAFPFRYLVVGYGWLRRQPTLDRRKRLHRSRKRCEILMLHGDTEMSKVTLE